MTTRIDKCTLMNDVKPGRLEVGRQQGRPRNHYIQNVRDWTDLFSLQNSQKKRWGNTDEWRGVVRRAMRDVNTEGGAQTTIPVTQKKEVNK